MFNLSIVTINFNNLNGLKDTLDSLDSQSFKEFEHVVIDGGSTDGGRELIIQNQDRFHYWVSERDNGIYHAINKGIQKCSAEYILILNSGDVLAETTTLQEINAQLSTGEDIIYGDSYLVNDDRGRNEILAPDELSFQFFEYTNLVHQSVIIRRILYDTVGLYDEKLKIVSDWKFYLDALIYQKASSKKINIYISRYDRTGVSSKSVDLLLSEKNKLLKENYRFFSKKYVEESKLTFRSLLKLFLPFGVVKYIQQSRRR